MTTALDTLLRPLASKLIAQYGKACTLRVSYNGAYDALNGAAPINYMDHAVVGVLSVPERILYDPGVVSDGDVQLILADYVLSSAPKPGDLVTLDNFDWTVVSVQSTFSGDFAAIHTLLLRK